MTKKAIIIYGPPGSGKGTQADLLAKNVGFTHFDTGKFVEKLVHDPALQDDPSIQLERKNFETGKLMTPAFVLEKVSGAAKKIAVAGEGLIFSGSPRTLYEAFGDVNTEGLVSILEGLYGKENIHVFLINVKSETSIARNSARGRKKIDDPEVIKIRLVEYAERTKPIVKKLEAQSYKVTRVDGESSPAEVHQYIVRHLAKSE
jgi:adenylate kinase